MGGERMLDEHYRVHQSQGVHVLELLLPDATDALEFDRVNDEVLALFEGKTGSRWVVDLSGVGYMGSAMLGLMVNLRQRIKTAGGKLVLSNLSPRLKEVFHACCMEQLFTIARTRNDAIMLLAR